MSPRRGDRLDRKRAHADRLAVRDGSALEPDGVRGVDEIAGAVGAGQDQPAGDVVIVHVRFGHVRDGYPGVTGGRLDAVRVALRVDRQRHRAVVDQVAAVPELRGLDDDDFHGPSGAVSP